MLVALALAAAAPATPPPPPPPPSCSTAEHRQLDFWVGDWDAEFALPGGKTGRAVNRITRNEFGDCVIAEHFEQEDIGYVGASYSMYDPARKKWVQTWVDNGGAYITLIGGPVEGRPYSFELVTVEPKGPKQTWSRMIWQDVKPDSFTWRWQARQADGSYSDSWVIKYKRRPGASPSAKAESGEGKEEEGPGCLLPQ